MGTIGTTRLLLEGLLVRDPRSKLMQSIMEHHALYLSPPTKIHFLSRILNASFMKKILSFIFRSLLLLPLLFLLFSIGQLVPFWVSMTNTGWSFIQMGLCVFCEHSLNFSLIEQLASYQNWSKDKILWKIRIQILCIGLS